MNFNSWKCKRCGELTVYGTYCENCKCEDCLNWPREEGQRKCTSCLRCDFCSESPANPNVNGYGQNMCTKCDDRFPKTRCVICLNWHRRPCGVCHFCKNKLPYQADLNCYGACRSVAYGYSSGCDCRYTQFQNK